MSGTDPRDATPGEEPRTDRPGSAAPGADDVGNTHETTREGADAPEAAAAGPGAAYGEHDAERPGTPDMDPAAGPAFPDGTDGSAAPGAGAPATESGVRTGATPGEPASTATFDRTVGPGPSTGPGGPTGTGPSGTGPSGTGPTATGPVFGAPSEPQAPTGGGHWQTAHRPPWGPVPAWAASTGPSSFGGPAGGPYGHGPHATYEHASGGHPGPGGYGGGPTPPPGWNGGGGPPPGWSGGGGPPGADGSPPRRKRSATIAIAAVTALVTSLIVGPAAAVATSALIGGTNPISSLTDGGQADSVSTGSVSEVAEKVLPSVVSIQSGSGGGSGVVISSDGEILTNSHVVAAAEGETVQVQFNDGQTAEAEILGTDAVSDLAVIKAEGVSGLTPATLGNSEKIEVGADVVAIGSPLGLSGTVTSGVVSAVDRPVNTGAVGEDQQQENPFGQQEQPQTQTSTVINAIQTDAPINPGNSGGPLINMNGEVIGVNTAIAGTSGQGESGSIGLGFAIPANQAKPIAEQLIETGSAQYAAMDATVSDVRGKSGVQVVEPSENGAAAEAGLREGDVITSIDGKAVDGSDALIAMIRSHQPDETVTIGYTRDGQEEEADVTLSAQSSDSIGS